MIKKIYAYILLLTLGSSLHATTSLYDFFYRPQTPSVTTLLRTLFIRTYKRLISSELKAKKRSSTDTLSPSHTRVPLSTSLRSLPPELTHSIGSLALRSFLHSLDTPMRYRSINYPHDSVHSICVSHDRSRIVTASGSDPNRATDPAYENTAHLWGTQTGRQLGTFSGHRGPINSIAMSRDNLFFITGSSDYTAKLWSTRTKKLMHTFSGHHSQVTSVAISSDDTFFITGSLDGSVKLWSTKTYKLIRTLVHPPALNSLIAPGVNVVAISENNLFIVTGSYDTIIRVWDTQTGKIMYTLSGHKYGIKSIAISKDSALIASGATDKTANLWNAQTGELIHTLTGHASWIHSVAISPDNTVIITGSSDYVYKLWDIKTGTQIYTFKDTLIPKSIAIEVDGSIIIAGYPEGDLHSGNHVMGRVSVWLMGSPHVHRWIDKYITLKQALLLILLWSAHKPGTPLSLSRLAVKNGLDPQELDEVFCSIAYNGDGNPSFLDVRNFFIHYFDLRK